MPEKIDVLKKRAQNAKAKALEYARKAQKAEKDAAEIERNADTRRKIIDGSHMQTEALHNPDIDALLKRRREEKLILDHDRALFGLAPLSEAEKDRRMAERNDARKRKAGTNDSSADAPREKESEAA